MANHHLINWIVFALLTAPVLLTGCAKEPAGHVYDQGRADYLERSGCIPLDAITAERLDEAFHRMSDPPDTLTFVNDAGSRLHLYRNTFNCQSYDTQCGERDFQQLACGSSYINDEGSDIFYLLNDVVSSSGCPDDCMRIPVRVVFMPRTGTNEISMSYRLSDFVSPPPGPPLPDSFTYITVGDSIQNRVVHDEFTFLGRRFTRVLYTWKWFDGNSPNPRRPFGELALSPDNGIVAFRDGDAVLWVRDEE